MRNTEKVNVYNLYDIVRKIGFSKLPEEQKFDFKIYAAITRWGTDFSHVLQSDSAQEQISGVLHRFNKYITDRNILPHDTSSTLLKLTTVDKSHLLNNMNDIDGHFLPEPARSLFLEFRHRMIYNKRNRYSTTESNKKHLIERLLKTLNQLTKVFGGLPQKDIHHRELAGRVRSNDYREAKITIYNFLNHIDLLRESGVPFDIDEIKIAYEYFLKKANNRPTNLADDIIGTFGLIRAIGFLNDFAEEYQLLKNVVQTELIIFPADMEDVEFVEYLHRLVPEHFSEDIEQKLILFYVATIHGSFYEPDAYTPEFQKEFTTLKNKIIRASEILEGLVLTAHIDRDEDEEEELLGVSNFRRWLKSRKDEKAKSPIGVLGDIDLRKRKKGFEYYEGVINPVRFWKAIEQIEQDQVPFKLTELISIYSRYTDSGNNVERLLEEPVARIIIQMCCDFINDNLEEDEYGDKYETFKIVHRFVGEPDLDDKLKLIMMIDPSEYSLAFRSRIQLIQFAMNETPVGDIVDFPAVFVNEVDAIFNKLSEMMSVFLGIPVNSESDVKGLGVSDTSSTDKGNKRSLAMQLVEEYNQLAASKSATKTAAKTLLDEIQDMIVNLKIRKTDPAADLIDEVQKNLVYYLQGKLKKLSIVASKKLDGFLFGIESASNKVNKGKRKSVLGNLINRKGFVFNYAFVTPFDFPDKYKQLERVNLPFEVDYLHEFYYAKTDFGNKPFLLNENPTARIAIIIMLSYINHEISKDRSATKITPQLIAETIPDNLSTDEQFDFIQRVDTKRFPNNLADEIQTLNYCTQNRLYHLKDNSIPKEYVNSAKRILEELRLIATNFAGVPMINDEDYLNDLEGITKKGKSKREIRDQEIAQQFIETAINSHCTGKSKKQATTSLILLLEKIAADSHFTGKENQPAIEKVIKELKKVAIKNTGKSPLEKKTKANQELAGWLSATDEQTFNNVEQVKPVMSVQEVADLPINEIPFNGLLNQLFGRPELGFTAMMYGAPGCGKSTLCLWLAKQLALNHGKVLYVIAEQYPKGSITSLVKRMNMEGVKNFDMTKYLSHANPIGYDFIFIDSVNTHKLGIQDFIQLKNHHPNKTFIVILQSTKDNSYRGGRDWEHEVDNVIYLESNKAEVTKSRFLLPGKSEVEIPDLINDKNIS